jgi:hypothetical protein
MNCLKCGKEVNQKPGKREKRFCSDSCRAGYSQRQKAAEKKIIAHPGAIKSKPIISPELTPYEAYKDEIKNAGSAQEIEKIVKAAKGDNNFGKWHKEQIEKYGIEISRTLDF